MDYVRQFDEDFAEEYMRVLDFLNQVQVRAWSASQHVKYERNLSSLLAICVQCSNTRATLLCDVSLIDKVVTYVQNLRKRSRHLLPVGSTSAIDTSVGSTSAIDISATEDERGRRSVQALLHALLLSYGD